MIPGEFDYTRPADIDAVLKVLKEREGEAKLLAGGHSLLPLLKFRLASPTVVVDLRGISGLDGITEEHGELRIGALATHRQIHEDPTVAAGYEALHDAAGGIGDMQIRNWGTIGGSCAHADPSADYPAVLIATHATVVCRSADGERLIPAREFFTDTFTTALEPNEMLTEVRFPAPGPRSGGSYTKIERRAGDFSTVGIAVQLSLAEDGSIADVGIGLTAVADCPFAATDAEAALRAASPDSEDALRRAGAAASAQSSPTTDSHGPADYKRSLVAELTVRAVKRAVERARSTQ